MEILTYPIGLVVGLLPVVANLGPAGSPQAQVLLDGRFACTVTVEKPTCTVDLGSDPHVHLLELVRRDSIGGVAERAFRWVNKPGAQAEVYLGGDCDQRGRECAVSIGWGHPVKLEPRSLVLTVDGRTVLSEVRHAARFRVGEGGTAVVSADLIFPDGRRASQTRVFGAGFAGSAESALDAIPVVVARGARPPASLGGLRVRSVEDAPGEVAFVVEPQALRVFAPHTVALESDMLVDGRVEQVDPLRRKRSAVLEPLRGVEKITVVVPDHNLGRFEVSPQGDWLASLSSSRALAFSGGVRLADAVASAGMLVGGSAHRRVVVLVVSGQDKDVSALTPAQARRYLADVMVPLAVWRVGKLQQDGWPDGSAVEARAPVGAQALLAAAQAVRATLDAQRIAWVEGEVNPVTLGVQGEAGVALAGRE